MWLLTLQLFKNSIDIQEKLRLNLHSLSVSVSELLEYGRKFSEYTCWDGARLWSNDMYMIKVF
jgi:hypothetical protein